MLLFVGAVAVNALVQGALRLVNLWPWIDHTIFQLGGGHSTTELIAAQLEGWVFDPLIARQCCDTHDTVITNNMIHATFIIYMFSKEEAL